jgi:16S rRNA (cytosine967-C5)-methyltransferase
LEETAKNLQRLGVNAAELIQGDAEIPEFVEQLGMCDRVLVDAPCSNLGVLRHNPEAKYRVNPQTLRVYGKRQLRLLNAAVRAVKLGGTLIYSVCTISDEETSGVVSQFLELNQDFSVSAVDTQAISDLGFVRSEGFLSTFPPPDNYAVDGFFAARFVKRS